MVEYYKMYGENEIYKFEITGEGNLLIPENIEALRDELEHNLDDLDYVFLDHQNNEVVFYMTDHKEVRLCPSSCERVTSLW